MTYYEIIFGSGCYQCYRFVVKVDEPTTDYGALIDALIDYGREHHYGFVVTEYEVVDDNTIRIDGWDYHDDEYIIGGNYGDVLLHYGDCRINSIGESEIGESEVIDLTIKYEEEV